MCQHHSKNKCSGSERNFDCKAFIDVKIKKVNRYSKARDVYLKKQPPLGAVVSLNLEHSHPIRTADMFRMLRVTDEVSSIFYTYIHS